MTSFTKSTAQDAVMLHRVRKETLYALHDDLVAHNVEDSNDLDACWICNLVGERPHKCLTQQQVLDEMKFWASRGRQRREEQDNDEDTIAYWKVHEQSSSKAKRVNVSLLAYHLACFREHGLPPEDKKTCSHLCGQPKCVNPRHLRWEDMQYNATRNYCAYFKVKGHEVTCLHEPVCVGCKPAVSK